MDENNGLAERKNLAHPPPVSSYHDSIIFFVTVCVAKRRPFLANSVAQDRLVSAWCKADRFSVGRYVIMPDHVHFFCCPKEPDASFIKWMEFWRSRVTRAWEDSSQKPIWQKDYWDRQIRRGESYSEKWEYVRNNPVRAGFVKESDDWPYQGEINLLRW